MTITHATWVYHRTEPARIVASQAEYDALGDGWADSPATVTEPAEKPKPSRRRAQTETA